MVLRPVQILASGGAAVQDAGGRRAAARRGGHGGAVVQHVVLYSLADLTSGEATVQLHVLGLSHRRCTAKLHCNTSCSDQWTSPTAGAAVQCIAGAAELHCNTSCCDRWTSPMVRAAVQRIADAAELQCNA